MILRWLPPPVGASHAPKTPLSHRGHPSPQPALSPAGFPPIPGLEPVAGTEADAVAAALAAAQKLASEEAAPAEEDGDEDEVWLRAQTPGMGDGDSRCGVNLDPVVHSAEKKFGQGHPDSIVRARLKWMSF